MKIKRRIKQMGFKHYLSHLENEKNRNGQFTAKWFQDALREVFLRLKKGNRTFVHQFGERISRLAHVETVR